MSNLAIAIKTSSATVEGFEVEFLIVGASTSAAYVSGFYSGDFAQQIGIINATLAPTESTSLPTGAQTVDLRFDMSVAVSGDSWQVNGVTIERLQ